MELQFSDIEREPTAEETETAKWEGYASLVSKMRRELAAGVDAEEYAQHGGVVVSDTNRATEVGRGDCSTQSQLLLLR